MTFSDGRGQLHQDSLPVPRVKIIALDMFDIERVMKLVSHDARMILLSTADKNQ